jgi:hypothetical protein
MPDREKSHGVDLRVSQQDYEKEARNYFSLRRNYQQDLGRLPLIPQGNLQQAALSQGQGSTPSQQGLSPSAPSYRGDLDVLAQAEFNRAVSLLLDDVIYRHPDDPNKQANGGQLKSELREMVQQYSLAMARGFKTFIKDGIQRGDKTFELQDMRSLTLLVNYGTKTVQIDLNYDWRRFLDEPLRDKTGQVFTIREAILSLANNSQGPGIISEKELEETLVSFFKEQITRALENEWRFQKTNSIQMLRFFNSQNVRPFALEIGVAGRENPIRIPTLYVESDQLKPLADLSREHLFSNERQVAKFLNFAVVTTGILITEMRRLGQRYSQVNSEAFTFLDNLCTQFLAHCYDQNTQKFNKNVFQWLNEQLGNSEFREGFLGQFLRLLLPGYVLEHGGQKRIVLYMSSPSAGGGTFNGVMLFQGRGAEQVHKALSQMLGSPSGLSSFRSDILAGHLSTDVEVDFHALPQGRNPLEALRLKPVTEIESLENLSFLRLPQEHLESRDTIWEEIFPTWTSFSQTISQNPNEQRTVKGLLSRMYLICKNNLGFNWNEDFRTLRNRVPIKIIDDSTKVDNLIRAGLPKPGGYSTPTGTATTGTGDTCQTLTRKVTFDSVKGFVIKQ